MEDNKKIRLDIGCGKNKKSGFIGIDIDPESHADIIGSALSLPFEDESVDEVNSSHLGEHFSPEEEQKFFDEIFRVLKKGGKALLKIDRDWSLSKLLKKDKTHRYRYTAEEIRRLTGSFGKAKVKNRIYFISLCAPRNKIFVELVK